MGTPQNYKFAKEHEWALKTAEGIKLGISDYAQKELGDVVYVDLPAVGKKIQKGNSFMTVESVKAVSDIYAPVDGVVKAINENLSGQPDLVNTNPYENGWMVVIEPSNESQYNEMMDAAGYDTFIATL